MQSIQTQVHGQHFRLKLNDSIRNQLAIKKKHNQSSSILNQDQIFSTYMAELNHFKHFSEDQNLPQTKSYSFKNQTSEVVESMKRYEQMPESLEKNLALLINQLSKLENQFTNSVYYNNQNKKPVIQNSQYLFTIYSNIKQYEKYIQDRQVKKQMKQSLSNIEEYTAKKEFFQATKEAKKLLRAIEPVSISKTLFYAQKAEEAAHFIENKTVILLIGNTGVGKSTTLLYLLGFKMQATTKENVPHIELKSNTPGVNIKNGESIKNITLSPLPRSETRYITGIIIDDSNYADEEVVLCDTPGFEDTNGPEVDIANGTGVVNAIRKANKVRIALLLSVPSLDEERMQPITKLLQLISKLIPTFNDYKSAFSYLFTKAKNNSQAEIHNKFNNLLKVEKNGEVKLDETTKAILKNIKQKTENEAWVVNPARDIKGTPEYEDILEDLIPKKNKRYITTPREIFNNYIAEQSKNKLIKQLKYHQYAIKVAINKQHFALAQYKLTEALEIKKLVKIEEINNQYNDIVKDAKKSWDDIGEKYKRKLEKELLSLTLLNHSVIDEYVKIYNLYDRFDQTLRKNHFPDSSISSESFILKLKEILVKLRVEILNHLLTSTNKSQLYLPKINTLCHKFKSGIPFLHKTYELIKKAIKEKENEFRNFISQEQFKEAGDILGKIYKAQILQKYLDFNIINIKEVYDNMQSTLLMPIENALKNTYKILGKKYKKNGKQKAFRFDFFNPDSVTKLKKHHKIIQKAKLDFEFMWDLDLKDTKKQVMDYYKDYIEQNIDFIKEYTQHAINLLKMKQQVDTYKINKIINCIRALRQLDSAIQNDTEGEYQEFQCIVNKKLQKSEKGIKNFVNQLFKNDQNQSAEDLAAYVTNLQTNQFLNQNQRKNKLEELERLLLPIIARASRPVYNIDLSLESPENFTKVYYIMHIIGVITESGVGNSLKKVENHVSKAFTKIRDEVVKQVDLIEEKFTRITKKKRVKNQTKLLNQLGKWKQKTTTSNHLTGAEIFDNKNTIESKSIKSNDESKDEKLGLIDDAINIMSSQVRLSEISISQNSKDQNLITTILTALNYLECASKVKWVEQNSDHNKSILDTLETVSNKLTKYLKKYTKRITDTIIEDFNTLDHQLHRMGNDSNYPQAVVMDAKKLYEDLRKIIQWKKYRKEELFDRYIKKNFMYQCSEKMENIVAQLLSISKSMLDKGSLEDIHYQFEITSTISKLDPFLDEKERKATNLCKVYQGKINDKINDKKILKMIENEDYYAVDRKIKELLKEREKIQENDIIQKKIKLIESELSNSISEIINTIINCSYTIYQKKNNQWNNNNQQELIKLIEKVNTAKNLFFQDKNSFLYKNKDQFNHDISKIKIKVNNWLKSIAESIKQDLKLDEFVQAKKSFQWLENIVQQLRQKGFPPDYPIKEMDLLVQERIKFLEETKFQIEKITLVSPLDNLNKVYYGLKKIKKKKELKQLWLKIKKEYREYLKDIEINIEAKQNIQEQVERLITANEMLNDMPKEWKNQVEDIYNQQKEKLDKVKKEIENQEKEVRNSKNPEKHIKLWEKYEENTTSPWVLDLLINKMKERSLKTKITLIRFLEQKKLSDAYSELEKLKKYKEDLLYQDFTMIHDNYYEARDAIFAYGDWIISNIGNTQPARIEKEPKSLYSMVSYLQDLTQYKETFLK